MGRRLVYPLLLLLLISAMLLLPTSGGGDSITVFAGSAVKPALEEAAEVFEAQSGTGVELHFGGSGRMLFQLKLSGRGDVYLAGSPEFIDQALEEGAVVQPRRLVYLVPAIIVVREDSNITGLDALAREGVRIGIADPHSVSVGRYAAEIITHSRYDIIVPDIT